MKHLLDLAWKENLAFECDMDGHHLVVDASKESGGDDLGPRPKKLMMAALAGCTGIDVVSILKKMKVEPEAFNVIVEGDVADEHPMRYYKMKVIYQFNGKDLPLDKLEKAVKLSEEKYCGVSAAYRLAMDLSTEIRIIK
jgi:putative redox protein